VKFGAPRNWGRRHLSSPAIAGVGGPSVARSAKDGGGGAGRAETPATPVKRRLRRPLHHPSLATLAAGGPPPPLSRVRKAKQSRSRGAVFFRVRVMRHALPKNDTVFRPSSEPFGVDRPNGSRSRTVHERTDGRKESKETERRQTHVQLLHLPAQRAPCGARSPVGVPLRLSPGRQLVPKARRQAMLSRTVRSVRSETAAPTGGRRTLRLSTGVTRAETIPVQ
jgi:hypothetical protein